MVSEQRDGHSVFGASEWWRAFKAVRRGFDAPAKGFRRRIVASGRGLKHAALH